MVEAAEGIGTGTSSRNSEVIHAGIYYPKGSLMARACVEGRRKLYDYCKAHDVPHRNCGKLIVATNAQEDAMLASIQGRAEANGVEGMRVLTAAEAKALGILDEVLPEGANLRDSAVAFVLSKGHAPVAVPNLANLSYESATATLQDRGLKIARGADQFSDTVQPGLIVNSQPADGKPVADVKPRLELKGHQNAIEAVASGYANLEYDLAAGERGSRHQHCAAILRERTGAEDAMVVNNCAAALVLALRALAGEREAIISRGELVEIGGSFRVPDIMATSGATLVEVGTTNRTHLKDYETAIGPETAAIMKVHPSNYAVQGFTKSVSAAELVPLAHARGLPVIEDLGSGTLVDLEAWGLPHEPTAREAIEAGIDVVTFSGDKLLGGPQAGLLVGRKSLIERIARNPMKRALRLDKIRLAALEATLRLYADPERLVARLPTIRSLARPAPEIRAQAERLLPIFARAIGAGLTAEIQQVRGQIGSGALPVDLLPSFALSARGHGLNRLADRLRGLPIPVIGRIEHDALLLDLRTLDDEAAFARQLEGVPT